MNWIKYDKDADGEMPEMNLNDPGTETVWICTDNPYADRYGVGSYEYSEDGGGWSYYGCVEGFNVVWWAKIEKPVQKMDERQIATVGTPLADQYDAEAEEDIKQGRYSTLQELVDYDKEIGI